MEAEDVEWRMSLHEELQFMRKIQKICPGIEKFWDEMKGVPQNPVYHGEGDVYIHTMQVMEKLKSLPGYLKLSDQKQMEVLLAAALHDVGKVRTTRMEEGNWVSPHHASAGAQRMREYLWKECGFCGNRDQLAFREAVCSLIRYHSLPVHAIDREDGLLQLAKFAETPATAEQLCLLGEADILGRIAPDCQELLEQVQLARVLAEEYGILDRSMKFSSPVTKRAWFAERNVQPEYPLYDDTWGEVILMSGLAGSGKDTWIRKNYDLPMISLDEIRKQMKIAPTENQLSVVMEAREQAKVFLRKHQPFVWNATNLTQRVRGQQVSLFERYGAKVKIVYLETEWQKNQEQNRGRHEAVPEEVLGKMLSILEVPMAWEARCVQWICGESTE